jgi:hypothetical protein
MIHLPKNGTRAKVWPEAGRKVAAMAPRADADFIPEMPVDGVFVVWDEFRYHQYLAGDIHLFDPETGVGEPYEFEHPHHEHNLELAAAHWDGPHGDRARDRLEQIVAEREKAANAAQVAPTEPAKYAPGAEHVERTPVETINGKGELHDDGLPGAPAAALLISDSLK